jgi:malate synthase
MKSQQHLEIIGTMEESYNHILTPDAKQFIIALMLEFNPIRMHLLDKRKQRQHEFDKGILPDFLNKTKAIRESNWTIATPPDDLIDRRVEITGPVDRKMVINALNSDAKVFMADFEDSNSPTWDNCIQGQINLKDAIKKTINYTDTKSKKEYLLKPTIATLMVRPRGWHLDEKHVLLDGIPVSASLFDFALFLFHNHEQLKAQQTGPYFYLPKLESHQEAKLWNDVFIFSQDYLNIPQGTIKATVLIETITAAFEMDEILYELKEHSAGLNCGRWDYIFSFIKKFRNQSQCLLPDRNQVTMKRHFLKSYVDLLIKTCHRRGAHAMGGMAAQIPIKGDEKANKDALQKVYEDKYREVCAGHDGTWVAHPGLIPTALKAFEAIDKNQLHMTRDDVVISAQDLLKVPTGDITKQGIMQNLSVGLTYIASWLKGNGCVPINHLMEDAATAEISRAQLWQWLKHGAIQDNGTIIDKNLIESLLEQQIATPFDEQTLHLFKHMIFKENFDEFLTLPAYDLLD